MLGVKILIEFLQITFDCAPVLTDGDSAAVSSSNGAPVIDANVSYEMQCFYNNQMVYWHPYVVFTFCMAMGEGTAGGRSLSCFFIVGFFFFSFLYLFFFSLCLVWLIVF